MSAITGPYASDGIGSQTASCSYTDGGGLTVSGSETCGIVDPSAPVITYTLNPTTPDGLTGWYTGNVSLDWTVSDAQSPNSLSLTGCVDQIITADQAATAYTCSATSAGGSAAGQSVTIKRDGTAPVVTYDSVVSGNPGCQRLVHLRRHSEVHRNRRHLRRQPDQPKRHHHRSGQRGDSRQPGLCRQRRQHHRRRRRHE